MIALDSIADENQLNRVHRVYFGRLLVIIDAQNKHLLL